jgi:hypothetical protein
MADVGHQPLGVNHVWERSVNAVAKLAFFSFILAWVLTRTRLPLRSVPEQRHSTPCALRG